VTRARCPRGHFLPDTGTCRCMRPPARRPADLWGQGLTAQQIRSITDIPVTGRYL
jgi:hypothetical protein